MSGISMDSRTTEPGDIFFALPGKIHDGSAFIGEACRRGAAAVICREAPLQIPSGIPYGIADNPRLLFSRCCDRFYGHPSSSLRVIGVTGTNGKSSVCSYLYTLMNSLGVKTGIISGYWTGIPGDLGVNTAGLSTPEAAMLHRELASMRDQGCGAAVVEVTSHALASFRVEDVSFETAVFTALGRDHLDYHRTMEEYLETKLHLLDLLRPDGKAAYSSSNEHADLLAKRAPGAKVYGRDVQALHEHDRTWALSGEGTQVRCTVDFREPFQRENLFLAVTAAWDLVSLHDALELTGMERLPGRSEVVDTRLGWEAVIDYAHNPQGFQAVLSSYPPPAGRQAALFGAAGGRDRGKRAFMGRAADNACDIIILTEEDPCDEDPDNICADLLAGITGKVLGETLFIIPDRMEALRFAVSLMQRGDRLFLLGKGHETAVSLKGGAKKPWNERGKLMEILATAAQ